jgi:hypothetical protein
MCNRHTDRLVGEPYAPRSLHMLLEDSCPDLFDVPQRQDADIQYQPQVAKGALSRRPKLTRFIAAT